MSLYRVVIGGVLLLLSFAAVGRGAESRGVERAAHPVYTAVMDELTKHPNRLPGSAGWKSAADGLTRVLMDHGVVLQRQIYRTAVPRTEKCTLTVDGVAVPGVFAVAPNGVAPTTTWGDEITGDVLYLGDGATPRLVGQRIAGAIVLLDLGSPAMADVFIMGAKAVVFVGAETTQWAVARHFTELTMSVPRAWISRADAERAGLLTAATTASTAKRATLAISTKWEQVESANLWTYIKAVSDTDAESAAQTIVLAAQFDTFGAVPEQTPQSRWAANCALLAEVAVRLHTEQPKRNVLVTFLGSHYSNQEGARALYWVVNKTIKASREADPLAQRQKDFTSLAEGLGKQVDILADPAFFTATSREAFDLTQRLRLMAVGQVNNLNYKLRLTQLERHAIEVAVKKNGQGSEVLQAPARLAELASALKKDTARKSQLNEFRRQLHEQHITDQVLQTELLAELTSRLAAERRDAQRMAEEAGSALALFEALSGQVVIAHLGFDFADAQTPWLVNPFIAKSMAYATDLNAGQFVKQTRACKIASEALPPEVVSAKLYTPDPSTTYQYFNLCTPRPLSRPSAAALALGIFGAQLQTVGDPLNNDELPSVQVVDLSPLGAQMSAFTRTLAAAEFPVKTGMVPAWFYDEKLVATHQGEWRGIKLQNYSHGSEETEGVAQRAAVIIQHEMFTRNSPSPEVLTGNSKVVFAYGDASGYTFCPNIIDNWSAGHVNAIGFAPHGPIDRCTVRNQSTAFLAKLFYGYGGGMFASFQPNAYIGTSGVKVLDARTDAEAKHQYIELGYAGHAFFVNHQRRVKMLFDQGLLLLGIVPDAADLRDREGRGFQINPAALIAMDPVAQSANDFSLLNRQRMGVLRSKNLINKPVERLQAEADDHLELAADARTKGDQLTSSAHSTIAAILANRAYGPLKETANDLLFAVIILLFLSIPFAFAAERLAVGAAGIYGQIGGFLLLFCSTFTVLYFTHPAFALASAPIIIFLAFVIILLSGFVIIVVMGKFKQELKALQGLAAKAHGSDNANSTWFAAVIIGISGMRNRPLKTFLTVTTVALLTFTILVFASFESTFGVQETYLGRSSGADRIELHTRSFQTIPARLLTSVKQLYGDRFDIYTRGVSFRDPSNQGADLPVNDVLWNPATNVELNLDAILGIQAGEGARLKGLFPELGSHVAPLYLSTTSAKHLGVTTGATIELRGKPFQIVGVFEEADLQSLENIDNSRVVPPNFEATFAALNLRDETAKANALQNIDPGTFIFCQAGQVAVTTPEALADLGLVANFISLYPKPGVDVAATAQELAPLFNGPLAATTADGAKRYYYTSIVSGSGYSELIVPLLLGGLIIFSSLLGSIVDRQKEIFTFSALGLAPRDVGMLFFAESLVIAVLGGMGGYLISQVVVKIMAVLAEHGLATMPAVNFSSSSSLFTILIVMAMVLLSTIYPAIMASRSANPGVNRSWKMPKPEGDTLRFTFPFTVPEKSFAGILGFVREHFESHGDASLDVFSAKRIAVHRVADSGQRLGISAQIALAPFDLGVLQGFEMHTRPSDIPGIDEVVVELTRLNGAPGTWLRGNRFFIEDLRNQFLVWRSLPVETVEHYQRNTAETVAEELMARELAQSPTSTSTAEAAHG